MYSETFAVCNVMQSQYNLSYTKIAVVLLASNEYIKTYPSRVVEYKTDKQQAN